jgi:pimeloyl-ACP methyl ester carboxylesterase
MIGRLTAGGLAAALLVTMGPAALEPGPAAGLAPRDRPATSTLAESAPCDGEPDFVCSTLTVPLDHTGAVDGSLDLEVAAADNVDAPHGVLLLLTGGPGQPGVGLLSRVKTYFAPDVLEQYRLVVLDQRGTGRGAIDCTALQETTGGSDFLTPPPEAVDACAETIGAARDFYSTPDTVADIETLRQALDVRQMTLDGVSYGTYVAEHYALAHPSHVRSLVLDSTVPQEGYGPLLVDSAHAPARVLRDACDDDPACTTDPAADLAWLVRHGRIDGQPIDPTRLMESLTIMSIDRFDPGFHGIPAMLHDARNGDTTGLEQFLNSWNSIGTPADQLSAGLHLATVCTDLHFPWGDSATPVEERPALLDAALADIPRRAYWPFTKALARKGNPIAGCARWPETRPAPYADRDTITARSLLLSGEHDLFTLRKWAKEQAARMLHARLVRFPGHGHGLQSGEAGREVVRQFLLD